MVDEYDRHDRAFPRTGEPVVGRDGIERWVIAIRDPPLGQVAYKFLVGNCPYLIWTQSGLTWEDALAYAALLATPTRSPDSGDAGTDQPEPQGAALPYSVTVADGVTDPQAATVNAFVRFAASPTAKRAAAVPFARTGIVISFETAEKRIRAEAVSSEAAWLLNDGEGTTSALFVISNSIRNARSDAAVTRFLATPRHRPICADTPDKPPARSASGLLYVSLASRDADACAPGFRVALHMGNGGVIHAVSVAARAP
jgi:hypothetical protein